MRYKVAALTAVVALGVPYAGAQPSSQDPLQGAFFPPEVVMQNQQALALTEEQKSYFKAEIRQAQARFTDLHWKLEDEVEKLSVLLKQPRADEQQVLVQLDRVLAAEREIKRAQITLLTRIKNKLTAEQQAKLREVQNKPVPK